MGREHRIRKATEQDADFLLDMLVAAVNWSPQRKLSRSAVRADPDLGHYVEGWPRSGDVGVVAEYEGEPIAAAWVRLFTDNDRGYGYVSDDIPELSMAVEKEWRGRGVGREVLREIHRHALAFEYRYVSLSVERTNSARHLYASEGYRVVGRGSNADTMVKDLRLGTPRRPTAP